MSEPTWGNTSPVGSASIPTWENTSDLSKYETPFQMAKTAAEGLARGATLGLSDVALSKLDPTAKQAIRGRKEANPALATGSNIFGAVGSLLLAPEAGPVGLLSKVGKGVAGATEGLVSNKLVSSAISKGLGSAVEGMGFAAGDVASELALGDPQLNAQKIASQIGIGALTGGALGGLFGIASETAPKIGELTEKVRNYISGEPGGEPGLPIKAFGSIAEKFGTASEKDLSDIWKYRNDVPLKSYSNGVLPNDVAEKLSALDKQTDLLPHQVAQKLAKISDLFAKKVGLGEGSLIKEGGFITAVAHYLGLPLNIAAPAIAGVEMVRNPVKTLAKLATIENITIKASKAIETGVKNAISTAEEPTIIAATKLEQENEREKNFKEFDKVSKKISGLANDQQTLMDHAENSTRNIYESAPGISNGIHSTIYNGVQFLNSKIPKSGLKDMFSIQQKPSHDEVKTFLDYHRVLNKPISVFDDIRNNRLSLKSVDALKTVYPDLYDAMRLELMNKIAESKQKPSYQKRLGIGLFLGNDLDSSTEPQMIAASQNSYNQVRAGNGRTEKNRTTQNGLANMNSASRYMTPQEKAVTRQEDRDVT